MSVFAFSALLTIWSVVGMSLWLGAIEVRRILSRSV